tara:strand:+ start:634 stop:1329 length:696 start_codon:yes stop_codon:yes gene_type:complete
MRTKRIDVLVTSASRVEYLQQTIASLQKHLKFDGKLNWVLHEDVVRQKGSKEVIDWAKKEGFFNGIMVTDPAKRQGAAVLKLLEAANSEFVIRTEDDWILTKDINLNDVVGLMEEHKELNQIGFSKKTNEDVAKWGEYNKYRFPLCLNWNWTFILSVWRKSWILKRWVATDRGDDIAHYLRAGCEHKLLDSEAWTCQYLGTYWWGGMKDGSYLYHIGEDSVLTSSIEGKDK